MWGGALYTVDKQLREYRALYSRSKCYVHVHSCLQRHSIPHHQWRIQDFSKGGASGQTQYGKGGGGGGGALTLQIFALQVLKFLNSL